MTESAQLVTLIERTVAGLSKIDESTLLDLEREATSLISPAPCKVTDMRSLISALKILRMTLDGTAANLRLVRRLRGEEGPWGR